MRQTTVIWLLCITNIIILTACGILISRQSSSIRELNALVSQQVDAAWKVKFVEANETMQALQFLKASHEQEAEKFLTLRIRHKVEILETHKTQMSAEQSSLFESLQKVARE